MLKARLVSTPPSPLINSEFFSIDRKSSFLCVTAFPLVSLQLAIYALVMPEYLKSVYLLVFTMRPFAPSSLCTVLY